jgi:hypothetical protein
VVRGRQHANDRNPRGFGIAAARQHSANWILARPEFVRRLVDDSYERRTFGRPP